MAGGLDFLLHAVKDAVMQHSNEQAHTGFDPTKLLAHLDQIFEQHGNAGFGARNVRPASQVPYGVPADDPRNH